ncbi:MAG: Gfo/Idh/MocA family oxidoreductase [Lentisphaeria bacterium]|nr:Gfo/Idh/MocA family oxidoreductase [Lentisphaeria bacterium]
MKKVRLILIGAGGRGTIYARHALQISEQVEVVAVADPQEFFRNRLGDMHRIPEDRRFGDWKEILDFERFADAVVITTQDRMHVAPAVAFARKGYHILLEKPLAPDEAGCREIHRAVTESGVMLATCLVLRYTNFTRTLKQLLDDGAVGTITSIQALEPTGHWRFAHAYVRGNWRKEADSSSVLMAKSIHDLDWLCYLVNARPKTVFSSGSLMFFRKEQQPEGAADRCMECALQDRCPYSAPRFYLDRIRKGQIDNYVESVTGNCTEENMLEVLKTSPYGRCVFACDNDVPDHQTVNLEFENGATAVFTMAGCSQYGKRQMAIFGSHGEIRGDGETLTLHTYLTGETRSIPIPPPDPGDRHGGGDSNLLKSFVKAIRTGDRTELITGLESSMESHMLVFAAERSRHENRAVSMAEMR